MRCGQNVENEMPLTQAEEEEPRPEGEPILRSGVMIHQPAQVEEQEQETPSNLLGVASSPPVSVEVVT